MKPKTILIPLAATALLLSITGCDNRKDSVAPTPPKSTAAPATDAVKQAVDSVKDTGAKVASDLAAPASAKVQAVIDSAKSLVAEGKFQDALGKLKGIAGEKLSVNQQAMVDALKAQIEKALAATSKAAADAGVGGLLKK